MNPISPAVAALLEQAQALLAQNKPLEATMTYGQGLLLADPTAEMVCGEWLMAKLKLCDWSELDSAFKTLEEGIAAGHLLAQPLHLLAAPLSAAQLKNYAQNFIAQKHPVLPGLPNQSTQQKTQHPRIKIGYFSADFHGHAVAQLTAELFELHDRSRFEVIAFSFGPSHAGHPMRERLVRAFDLFLDVDKKTDQEIAQIAQRLEIDIAVDLLGFTAGCRTSVFAYRPAPVVVNYLGYPCTMGASYVDYLIGDPVLIPPELRSNYTEKIAYLPNCYQPNDRQRAISQRVFTKAECGLPAHGFVFACLNVQWKILPAVFDVWMRILQKVPGSVLWLLDDNQEGSANLRRRASERGVDPARLVFAPRMVFDEHLARQRLADLFLDTTPYNSHTTGSDALWAGVPLLTTPGQTFASRVGASLVTAAGLPELVALDFVAYEARAVELASDFDQILAFKKRLADTHLSCALFDTPRFARDIETLYEAMLQRHRAGLAPEHLFSSCRPGG